MRAGKSSCRPGMGSGRLQAQLPLLATRSQQQHPRHTELDARPLILSPDAVRAAAHVEEALRRTHDETKLLLNARQEDSPSRFLPCRTRDHQEALEKGEKQSLNLTKSGLKSIFFKKWPALVNRPGAAFTWRAMLGLDLNELQRAPPNTLVLSTSHRLQPPQHHHRAAGL